MFAHPLLPLFSLVILSAHLSAVCVRQITSKLQKKDAAAEEQMNVDHFNQRYEAYYCGYLWEFTHESKCALKK